MAIRALSLGNPLVVSDVGWFSELPDDVVAQGPRRRARGRGAGRRARATQRRSTSSATAWARLPRATFARSTISTVSPTSTRAPATNTSAVRRSRPTLLGEVARAVARGRHRQESIRSSARRRGECGSPALSVEVAGPGQGRDPPPSFRTAASRRLTRDRAMAGTARRRRPLCGSVSGSPLAGSEDRLSVDHQRRVHLRTRRSRRRRQRVLGAVLGHPDDVLRASTRA